ncbi:hypothetical protein LCGC14_0347260 [marine sediment metagenome]|uniref:Uncharacterized protein n=1 Tax=marine sediment metagenome TaxID=412755 RepID=A0A0F9TH94_9ZZZZ
MKLSTIKSFTFYSYIIIMNLLVATLMLGSIGARDFTAHSTTTTVMLYSIPPFYLIVSSMAAIGQARTGSSRISMTIVYTLTVPLMLMFVPLFQNF